MADALRLLLAIACELTATGLLKASDGLTRPWPCVGVAAGYLASLALLADVLKRLPVGPAYAAWAGLGTVGAAVIGAAAYGDRVPPGGWAGVGLVVAGVVLLGYHVPRAG